MATKDDLKTLKKGQVSEISSPIVYSKPNPLSFNETQASLPTMI